MTTTRSWAASTSEPAMLQRRSEVHGGGGGRGGGARGPGCWSGSFSGHLGLLFAAHPVWSSLWWESRRGYEARMVVSPRGASLPTRDTWVVHPVGKAGPGNPGHRDQGEKCSPNGEG